METSIENFWQSFLDSLPADEPKPEGYQAWHYSNNPTTALELAELTHQGIKTATSSLYWSYQAENEALPVPGSHHIITDFDGRPICIIQTKQVLILQFPNVDPQIAFEEGEGDRSLEYWRKVHWDVFLQDCLQIGREPDPESMMVVCERFKLVYPAVNTSGN
jgi:uncharacterized protein YhfF